MTRRAPDGTGFLIASAICAPFWFFVGRWVGWW